MKSKGNSPDELTLNPEPRTLNLELSIVIPVPAVYNSYMITIL